MSDTNITVQAGNIVAAAELKYTQSGKAVCNFTIANNQSFKKNDNWEQHTNFFDCHIWGSFGETMHKHLLKGKHCTVTGELRQERWETEGHKQTRITINVTAIDIKFEKKQEPAGEQPPQEKAF